MCTIWYSLVTMGLEELDVSSIKSVFMSRTSHMTKQMLISNIFSITDYVTEIRNILFQVPVETLECTLQSYQKNEPLPLISQFVDKLDKEQALEKMEKRKAMTNELYPSGR